MTSNVGNVNETILVGHGDFRSRRSKFAGDCSLAL